MNFHSKDQIITYEFLRVQSRVRIQNYQTQKAKTLKLTPRSRWQIFSKLLLFVKMDINLSLILSSFAVKGSMHEITKVFFLQSFTSSKSIIIPCLSVQNAAGSNYHHQFGTHIWFSKTSFLSLCHKKCIN